MQSLYLNSNCLYPIDSAYFEALNADTSFVGCWESRALLNRIHQRDMRFFFLEVEDASGARKVRSISDKESEISSLQEKTMIKVYPNPSQGSFIIETGGFAKNLDYVIIDLLGRTINTGPILSKKQDVEMGHLPSGIYSLIIHKENSETSVFKIIIQK